MSKASERLRRRREAKGQLTEINKKRDNVVVIHYSCESFYDRPDGNITTDYVNCCPKLSQEVKRSPSLFIKSPNATKNSRFEDIETITMMN